LIIFQFIGIRAVLDLRVRGTSSPLTSFHFFQSLPLLGTLAHARYAQHGRKHLLNAMEQSRTLCDPPVRLRSSAEQRRLRTFDKIGPGHRQAHCRHAAAFRRILSSTLQYRLSLHMSTSVALKASAVEPGTREVSQGTSNPYRGCLFRPSSRDLRCCPQRKPSHEHEIEIRISRLNVQVRPSTGGGLMI
jgi:hypothetical protein